VIEA
jgi:hypothetical protein